MSTYQQWCLRSWYEQWELESWYDNVDFEYFLDTYFEIVDPVGQFLDNELGKRLMKRITNKNISLQKIITQNFKLYETLKEAKTIFNETDTSDEDEMAENNDKINNMLSSIDKDLGKAFFRKYKELYPNEMAERERNWDLAQKIQQKIDSLPILEVYSKNYSYLNNLYIDLVKPLTWDECYRKLETKMLEKICNKEVIDFVAKLR